MNLQKEVVNLLFKPESLTEINLREPNSHQRYIQAYAHLEFQEGFLLGLFNDNYFKATLEETVTFFIDSLRMNQMGKIIDFYEESKKEQTKYSTALFFLFLHKANKELNRYGLITEI